ncbi:MAG TPA: hypothetical protein VGB99_05570 [Acidobacteriota bacterium]
MTSAGYDIALAGDTATFAIEVQESFSPGSHNTLAEGFIQFTIDQPYQYELSGSHMGSGTDGGDAYQQRTFLRRFESPFNTIYLEDETGFGTSVSLAVNQRNDTAGGLYNQFGPVVGMLGPGTYEFMYELEGRDHDLDRVGSSMAAGSVALILRPPQPNPVLSLHLNGASFAAGQTLIVTAALTPGTNPMPVDVYLVLGLPNGSLLSLTAQGLAPGLVPIVRGLTPILFSGELLRYNFTGFEPAGDYNWYAGLTQAGTATVIGTIDQDPFRFSP